MTVELSQRFYFEAAHSLERSVEAESSRRIHGHTYLAEIAVSGTPDPVTRMVVDLADLRAAVAEVREALDHRLLNDVEGLGRPTLEALCAYIWQALEPRFAGLTRVSVRREASGDACAMSRVRA